MVRQKTLADELHSSSGNTRIAGCFGNGAIAKRLCTGLQIRVGRFDSGSRLQIRKSPRSKGCGDFFCGVLNPEHIARCHGAASAGAAGHFGHWPGRRTCTAERKRDDLVFWPSSQTEQARVQAMNEFVARAAEKLRRDSLAGRLIVFIHNIPSGRGHPQYSRLVTAPLRATHR